MYVNIGIAEEDTGAWVENTTVNFIGKAEDLMLDWSGNAVQVHVTGHRSDVEALLENGVEITVDLSGLGAGEHDCKLLFPVENYPNVLFTPETPTLHLTLTEMPEE